VPDERNDETGRLRIQAARPPAHGSDPRREVTMFRQPMFAGLLVFSGVLCVAVSVHSGTALDTAYVHWSATKIDADSRTPPTPPENKSPPYYSSPLAGAPLSILSPTLIWLSFLLGLLLIVLGLASGFLALRRQRREYDKARLTQGYATVEPFER
jgi:hypothetical protein